MNRVILKEKQENISLSELYEKFADDVFKYSFSILKIYDEAKDAVQEVFANYAGSEKSFKRNCSQKTWLLIITRNYCYNRLKSKNFNLERIDERIFNKTINPDYDTKISMEKALKKLSHEYSELVYLKDYEGYSYKEIAEIMGTTLENIKIRLFRARRQLKNFLKGEM